MEETELERLISGIVEGSISADDAMRRLRRLPYADLGFARVDHHRAIRQGLGEVVYAPGKAPEQCATIVGELLGEPSSTVLLTRATKDQGLAAEQAAAEMGCGPAVVTPTGELALYAWRPAEDRPERVVVVTAGTSDLDVAGECIGTLEALGIRPKLLVDCGVAGLHRLLDVHDELVEAELVVVVAGMEGALASVVGGLTGAPVVAVPTSAGYGSSFEGLTALLAMMSSCAAGITVVGIDNGFGAACAAIRMFR